MVGLASFRRMARVHPWRTGAVLFVVLGTLMILAALPLFERPPRRVARPIAPRIERALPTPAARPDDAAVLLNNTPLAIPAPDAVAINAARAVDQVRLSSARPFLLATAAATMPLDGGGPRAALQCLTQAIYYEAASESDAAERAVAQVVLNRVRHPIFPHSVCGAVFQGSELRTGCQFSFTCDGSLARRPSVAGWARARRIAAEALAGRVEPSVGLATHYHADYVVPYWAGSLDKVRTIGAHIFYVMRGPRGRPDAFGSAYDPGLEAEHMLAPAMLGIDDAVTGGAIGPKSPDRTVVREDALGSLAVPAPAVQPGAKPSLLRADETAGELLIDQPRTKPPRR